MVGQRDEQPHVRAFLAWLQDERVSNEGIRQPGDEKPASYISLSALQLYLTKEKVRRLLSAVYDDESDDRPDAANVHGKHLRPFAILVCIGFGHLVHRMNSPEFEDEKLPLRAKPSIFPTTGNGDLWAAFSRHQWRFYPKVMDRHWDDHRLHNDEVLPLQFVNQREKGGSSFVRKALIDPEYNKLHSDGVNDLVGVVVHK